MILFDGVRVAAERETDIAARVAVLKNSGIHPSIVSFLFTEDTGSTLYTRLKQEAAQRVGIGYEVHHYSLADDLAVIQADIRAMNAHAAVTGIIIQKPWRKTWIQAREGRGEQPFSSQSEAQRAYTEWWQTLTQTIAEEKDVDGLHPSTLRAVEQGSWRVDGKVLPATAQAVLHIVRHYYAGEGGYPTTPYAIPKDAKIVIIGKSDIVGTPLYLELKYHELDVEMIGSKGLQERIQQGVQLTDADIVVSATGRERLLTGEMIRAGAVVIDVGEPRPDVEFESVSQKAAFLTPVPGGVGPLTVSCLLDNCVQLAVNT